MLPITRKILEGWSTPGVFSDAMRYHKENMVAGVKYENRIVTGEILRSARPLRTKVRILDDSSAENFCPCSDNRERGIICAHVIAVCLELLRIYSNPERKQKLEQEQRRAERLASFDENEYLQRVTADFPGAKPARLLIGLAEHWRQGAKIDAVPVMIRISYDGKENFADAIPSHVPLHFSEADENLLFVLEDIAEGPASGQIEMSLADFLNVLDLVRGKTIYGPEQFQVQAEKIDSKLKLVLDEFSGEMVLQFHPLMPDAAPEDEYTSLVQRRSGWICQNGIFAQLARVLPEPMHSIYHSPIVIDRANVPRFLKTELPHIQQAVPVETDLDQDSFDTWPAQPRFRLQIKGSPASLSAILYARYGDDIELVAGKNDSAGDFAIPDEDDLLRYRVRNPAMEEKALESLFAYGFGGQVGDALQAIVGTRQVMNFLGSSLPVIRRKGWKVDLEGRINALLEDVEFVTPVVDVQRGEGGNWFEVGFEFETSEGTLSNSDIQRAIRMGDSYVEMNGKKVLFDHDAVASMSTIFDDCATGEGSGPGRFKMNEIHSAYIHSSLNALDGVDFDASSDWVDNARAQNRDGALDAKVELSDRIDKTLRPYQREGIVHLRYWENRGFCGILADEMGLGKTLQTLAWIQMSRANDKLDDKPVLIVCPTSLVENWIEEGEKFTPELSFLNITGPQRKARFPEIATHDVSVTSYGLVRRDIDELRGIEFSIVALDEAQNIKNQASQNAQAVRELNAGNRLALTGTPVENSVTDLWSIMNFLMPMYLGPYEQFKANYEAPIKRGGDESDFALTKLRRKLHPFLIRRLKKDVAKDLPPKIEKVMYCTLTPDQKKVYKEILEFSQNKIADMVSAKGFNKSRMEIFKMLLRLRQASCHLDLLKMPGLDSKDPSGKLNTFLEMLDEAKSGGHRVLVFSQFTSMLSILREALEERSYRYNYLDGSTKKRQDLVRSFNGDPDILAFLISLKAGGTGLNLTGADMVIHFDPWWNPAVENQATDRAYRIGQKRTVYAQKLIARGTVEEKVLEMQEKKKKIIDATLSSDEQVMNKLEWEDVQDLLGI